VGQPGASRVEHRQVRSNPHRVARDSEAALLTAVNGMVEIP
jgi:hypothetical protein